jgi:hypothetical protein
MANKVIIDNLTFPNAKQAAKRLQLPYSTVRDRILSTNNTWIKWCNVPNPLSIKINGRFYNNIDTAIVALCMLKIKERKK